MRFTLEPQACTEGLTNHNFIEFKPNAVMGGVQQRSRDPPHCRWQYNHQFHADLNSGLADPTHFADLDLQRMCTQTIGHSELLPFRQRLLNKHPPNFLLDDAFAAYAASSTVINVVALWCTPTTQCLKCPLLIRGVFHRGPKVVQTNSMLRCSRCTTPHPIRMYVDNIIALYRGHHPATCES